MNRENQFYEYGVMGRKTGLKVPDQERDASGLEIPEGYFTPSPAPDKTSRPLNAFITGSQKQGLNESNAERGSRASDASEIAAAALAVAAAAAAAADKTISAEESMDLDSGPGPEPSYQNTPSLSVIPRLPHPRSPFRQTLPSITNALLSSPARRASSVGPNTPGTQFTPVNHSRGPSVSPVRTTTTFNRVLNFHADKQSSRGVLQSPLITGQPPRRPRTPSAPPPAASAAKARELKKRGIPFNSPMESGPMRARARSQSVTREEEVGVGGGGGSIFSSGAQEVNGVKQGGALAAAAIAVPRVERTKEIQEEQETTEPPAKTKKTAISTKLSVISLPKTGPTNTKPVVPFAPSNSIAQQLKDLVPTAKKKLLSSRPSVKSHAPFSLSDGEEDGYGDMSTSRNELVDEVDSGAEAVGVSGKKWKVPKSSGRRRSIEKAEKAEQLQEKSGGFRGKPKPVAEKTKAKNEGRYSTIPEEGEGQVAEEVGEERQDEEQEEQGEAERGLEEEEIPVPVKNRRNNVSLAPATSTRGKNVKSGAALEVSKALVSKTVSKIAPGGGEGKPTVQSKKDVEADSAPLSKQRIKKAAVARGEAKTKRKEGRKKAPDPMSDGEEEEAVEEGVSPPSQAAPRKRPAGTAVVSSPSLAPATKEVAEPEPESGTPVELEPIQGRGKKGPKKAVRELAPVSLPAQGEELKKVLANLETRTEQGDEVQEPETESVAKGKGKGKGRGKGKGKGKGKGRGKGRATVELQQELVRNSVLLKETGDASASTKPNARTKGKGKTKVVDEGGDEEIPDFDASAASQLVQEAESTSALNDHRIDDDGEANGGSRKKQKTSKSKTSKQTIQKPTILIDSPEPETSQAVKLSRQTIHIAPLTAPSVSPSDVNKRRSGRARMAPLAWWNGEKVLTKIVEATSGNAGAKAEVRKEVVRVETVPESRYRKKAPARVRSTSMALESVASTAAGRKRKRTVSQSALAESEENASSSTSEGESDMESWELQSGELRGLIKSRDGSGTLVKSTIAYAPGAMVTTPVAGATFRMNKTLSYDHMGTGLIEIPPGGSKRWKMSGRFDLVFYVLKGRVGVAVGSNMFVVRKGGQFQVAKGNLYSIENQFSRPAKLFFAQGCDNPEAQ